MLARRKQKQLIDPKIFLGLIATLVCIVIVLANPRTFFVLSVVIAGVIIFVKRLRHTRTTATRDSLLIKADAVIRQQTDALVRRRAQLVRQDAYGKWELDKWEKEINSFIAQHIATVLSRDEQSILAREQNEIARKVIAHVEAATRDKPAFQAFSDKMTPSEFEFFCAEQLRQSGWNARVTLRSRDQGVDVVAEKADVRVVLQCKLYSGAVGNKAVQEIAAGKAHEQARHGAVVTNSRYTSAAEQLASTNGILLLHYSDLANLETLCSPSNRPATECL